MVTAARRISARVSRSGRSATRRLAKRWSPIAPAARASTKITRFSARRAAIATGSDRVSSAARR
jgi:hypothetical protein